MINQLTLSGQKGSPRLTRACLCGRGVVGPTVSPEVFDRPLPGDGSTSTISEGQIAPNEATRASVAIRFLGSCGGGRPGAASSARWLGAWLPVRGRTGEGRPGWGGPGRGGPGRGGRDRIILVTATLRRRADCGSRSVGVGIVGRPSIRAVRPHSADLSSLWERVS